MIGMIGQGGMVYMLHLGMVHQILYHLLGVLGMALQPQGHRFQQ